MTATLAVAHKAQRDDREEEEIADEEDEEKP